MESAESRMKRCHCCYSENASESIHRQVNLGGETTSYYNILRETFNVTLNTSAESCSVCAVCALRLCDAANFRSSVVRTQKQLEQAACMGSVVLKIEAEDVEAFDFAYSNDDAGDPDYSDEDDKPLKNKRAGAESEDAKLAANLQKALALMKPKLKMEKLYQVNNYVRRLVEEKGEDYELPSISPAAPLLRKVRNNSALRMRVPRFHQTVSKKHSAAIKTLPGPKFDVDLGGSMGTSLLPAEKRAARRIILQNAIEILRNTTACPFIYYYSNFRCFYCKQQFFEFHQLKSHTRQMHIDVNSEVRKVRAFRDILMIDISDLKCRKCDEQFDDIDCIKKHLITTHSVQINLKHNDDIAAFKIDAENFNCHLCGEEFHVFRNLSLHLNKHYANYMCDVCGKPFISYERYKNHEITHTEGKFKCAKCEEVFSTQKAHAAHYVSEHRLMRYGCPMCAERFEKYLQRTVHLSNVHNIKYKFKCPHCSKEFYHKPHMRAHIQNIHRPREKKVECSECGMRFKDSNALSRHMVTHTGEKMFACRLCGKKYGRKYSLTEHMRAHARSHARSRPTPPGLVTF